MNGRHCEFTDRPWSPSLILPAYNEEAGIRTALLPASAAFPMCLR